MEMLSPVRAYLDDLLGRIATIIQLDDTRRSRADSSYSALTDLLESHFEGQEIDMFPQGSFAIGTTVKPLSHDEYDLDFVLLFADMLPNASIRNVLESVHDAIRDNGRYADKVELKTRCVRVTYEGDFYVDILPAIPDPSGEENSLLIPDRDLSRWLPSSPKGFMGWFEDLCNERVILERALAATPLPPDESLHLKAPLKVAVQLTKRRRDVMLADEDWRPSSILLTTLLASAYRQELSPFESLSEAVGRVSADLERASADTFTVPNPTNLDEDFTDKWEDRRSCFNPLRATVKKFRDELQRLVHLRDITDARESLAEMFGETSTQRAFEEQAKWMADQSSRGSRIVGVGTSSNQRVRSHTFYGEA